MGSIGAGQGDQRDGSVLGLGVSASLIFSLTLPARAELVRTVRKFVALALGMDSAADDACHSAEVIVSELVTNVVRHHEWDPEPFAVVSVSRLGRVLRIEVRDSDPVCGEALAPDESAESGRGLQVVAALSERWGTKSTSKGKLVWSELVAWSCETAGTEA